MGVKHLSRAKAEKNDEFYTPRATVEAAMAPYAQAGYFCGQSILLPCDDPDQSEFTRYFASRFEQLGLLRLVSTCYCPGGRGRYFDLRRQRRRTYARRGLLSDSGDFRSPEVTALRDQADLIITNPPFSLLRAFVNWSTGIPLYQYGQRLPYVRQLAQWYMAPRPRQRVWFIGGLAAANSMTTFDAVRLVPLRVEDLYGCKFTTPEGGMCDISVFAYTDFPPPRPLKELPLRTLAENLALGARYRWIYPDSTHSRKWLKIFPFGLLEVPRSAWLPSDAPGWVAVPVTILPYLPRAQWQIYWREDHFRYVAESRYCFKRLIIRRRATVGVSGICS